MKSSKSYKFCTIKSYFHDHFFEIISFSGTRQLQLLNEDKVWNEVNKHFDDICMYQSKIERDWQKFTESGMACHNKAHNEPHLSQFRVHLSRFNFTIKLKDQSLFKLRQGTAHKGLGEYWIHAMHAILRQIPNLILKLSELTTVLSIKHELYKYFIVCLLGISPFPDEWTKENIFKLVSGLGLTHEKPL